ncbi:hypothetical protein CSUB01_10207 [Colletotrichum sublineola]|uniref:Uncharacterized protein n=1 Tax=Colletotrichum sublineola TaxID=1173701 RepID=A0A066XPE7_COLSU|nr:hypothetical protein CSUB01_10207 [Colletotrichum sublineola]
MYGCKAQTIDLVSRILRKFQDQALHPLLIPMVFAELERKRLFGMLDRKQTSLQQRILDLENKLRGESQSGILENAKNAQSAENADITAQTRDCESTKLWIDVSSLKNGLESLKDQLVKMAEHSEELAATVFKPPPAESAPGTDQYAEERKTGERFAIRLREMVTEFDSKVRSCDSLLGGMTLAAQMESNYYTRRDAKVAIIIANLTKKDGSQMRSISLLGMLFLPGTFLATLFSASFFNWTAASSKEVISPWIALYCALTVALTSMTVWRMKKWMAQEEEKAARQIRDEVNNDKDSIV